MISVNSKIGHQKVQFTPAYYKYAYTQYKNGNYTPLISMMDETKTDSHVFGCLQARRAGFQREFTLKPYSSDIPNDVVRTDWLTTVLQDLGMRHIFKAIQEAVLKKYSVIDFDWEIVEGKHTPLSFKKHAQRYFKYDEKGELKIDFGSKDLREIPEDALVCSYDDMPILLPVLRDYILKNFGLESWASFLEVFGEPIIMGYYPPGASPEDIAALEKAVKAIASSSRGTAPKGTSIEINETQRNSGDHVKFVETADNGISIALLGHENAVKNTKGLQVGENHSSYYAKLDVIRDDCYFIEEQFQPFIRRIWDRNFGDGHYPRLDIDKAEPVNVEERMDLLDLYLRHGGKVPADEFRKLGLNVPDDVEFIVKSNVPGF